MRSARRGPPKSLDEAFDRHAVPVHAARPAVRKVRRRTVVRSFGVISTIGAYQQIVSPRGA
jgi:hypothetical protein